ncbi:hypothetical protein RJ639_011017 [Escallonia herrerae]|uniref:DNA ligase ATP-dependent N-terminal domain-containing protein n=1 Tax=Escallonia herrerae TaxID=1293975 RepID=A0AA88VM32_9ASTE|nr:hypothetical protein RJ639_011017 [Escallonia herrerae]
MAALRSNTSPKTSAKKRSKFRKFLDAVCGPGDYFAAVRLILPGLDRERGSYRLRESVLAMCLIDALGMSRDSPDAVRLINWRKGGAKDFFRCSSACYSVYLWIPRTKQY